MLTPKLSNDAIFKATGKGWSEWVEVLDKAGARDWEHTKIANWLREENICSENWWNQAVVIGYEQAIGRREIGQRCDGEYSAAVSKTLPYDLDSSLEKWIALVATISDYNGRTFPEAARISSTEKWRYWRNNLDDGTQVNVNISIKSESKSALGLEHNKLENRDDVDTWKTFWKTLMLKL
jgi:hypothetical protein